MDKSTWKVFVLACVQMICFGLWGCFRFFHSQETLSNYVGDLSALQSTSNDCNVDINKVVSFGSFYGISSYYVKKGYDSSLASSNTVLSIATICDMNRLSSAKHIATNFNGILSIAIYIESLEMEVTNKNACHKIKESFATVKNKYDIIFSILYPDYSSIYYKKLKLHHITTPFEAKFPTNALRNLAISQIKTKYVTCLDVDFIFMSKTINLINELEFTFLSRSDHDNEKKVYVIPSFEWNPKSYEEYKNYLYNNNHENDNKYLLNKTELLQLIKLNHIRPFHIEKFKPAQICTNYTKWYTAAGYNYVVNYCTEKYEPWIILTTKDAQNEYKWDNDYIGYGKNKLQQITLMAYHCYEFEIIHNMFIIHNYTKHPGHKYNTNTKFRQFNKQKYDQQFRFYCQNPNTCWSFQLLCPFPYYIFQIGFNKVGTRSLENFFELNNIPSLHYKTKQKQRLMDFMRKRYTQHKPILNDLIDKFRYYGDFHPWFPISNESSTTSPPSIFSVLVKQYKNAKFILNIRDVNHWLKSRYLHFSLLSNAFLVDLEKYGNQTIKDIDVIVMWKNMWYEYNCNVIKYFAKYTDLDLLIFDIEIDPIEKLINFFNKFNLNLNSSHWTRTGESKYLSNHVKAKSIQIQTPKWNELITKYARLTDNNNQTELQRIMNYCSTANK